VDNQKEVSPSFARLINLKRTEVRKLTRRNRENEKIQSFSIDEAVQRRAGQAIPITFLFVM